MQSAGFSPRTLEAIYRFALLLTGDPRTASDTVLEILREGSGHATQFRNDAHRNACLAMKVRDLCLKKERAAGARAEDATAVALPDGAGLEAAFPGMPEPQRSVLALFYLELFPASELAQIFRMKPDRLADALADGRDFSGRASPPLHERQGGPNRSSRPSSGPPTGLATTPKSAPGRR